MNHAELVEAVSNPGTQDQTIAELVAERGPEATRAYLESLGFEFEDPQEAISLSTDEQRQVEQVEADLYKQVEQVATDKQFELPDQLKEHVVDHMLMYQTTAKQAFEAVVGLYLQAFAAELAEEDKRPVAWEKRGADDLEPTTPAAA